MCAVPSLNLWVACGAPEAGSSLGPSFFFSSSSFFPPTDSPLSFEDPPLSLLRSPSPPLPTVLFLKRWERGRKKGRMEDGRICKLGDNQRRRSFPSAECERAFPLSHTHTQDFEWDSFFLTNSGWCTHTHAHGRTKSTRIKVLTGKKSGNVQKKEE